MTQITQTNDSLSIRFDSFGAADYPLFLKCKALPESNIKFDYSTESYTIETHSRYANLLGLKTSADLNDHLPLSEFLFEHQREIVKLAIQAKTFAVWADCGLGKGQPYGSCILTPTGWDAIDNLRIGDLVIASDGKAYPVTGVFPKSEQKTYRVYFSDRTSFVVDEDHLHIVRTNNDRQRRKDWRVIDTKTLLSSSLRYGANGKSRNFDIPVVAPVEFGNNKPLPIHPYLLGILLGDGCIKHSSTFSNPEIEIVNRIKIILGDDYKVESKDGKDWVIKYHKHGENPLTQSLRDLKLFGCDSVTKFIPLNYLYSSVGNRIELLRGLMDSDGYIKDTCQFYSISPRLTNGVRFLIRSLGGVPTKSVKKKPKYTYKVENREGQDCYVLTFSLKTFNPFWVSRKAKLWNPKPRDNGRWIDRIEFEKVQPTVCISVASPDSSYVTENFIVTHNTNIELEFARQIKHITGGGRSLILTLPEVALQTLDECKEFYGKELPLLFLETKTDMRRWCEKGDNVYKVAITNYEKMNPDESGQIISEMKNLSGFIVDENRLKGGGGKQKWAIIKSSKGIPYKMTCTATPAPNDYIEFASQASFLERMRSENEIIWTFFTRDKDTQEWTVKKHAADAFFKWMSAWSIYVRNPRAYGWSFDVELPPDPEIVKYEVPITEPQQKAARQFNASVAGQMSLFTINPQGMVNRGKLSQIAKGFLYRKDETTERIESLKPAFVAQLALSEYRKKEQQIIWTVFDEESEILADELKNIGLEDFAVLTGKTKDADRTNILNRFRAGELPVLVSNSKMLGYGMNLQMCGAMILSGFNDSFEDFYQLVRRAVRFGNLKRVRIHIPYIAELELPILENVLKKEGKFIEAVEMQEKAYIKAMKGLKLL